MFERERYSLMSSVMGHPSDRALKASTAAHDAAPSSPHAKTALEFATSAKQHSSAGNNLKASEHHQAAAMYHGDASRATTNPAHKALHEKAQSLHEKAAVHHGASTRSSHYVDALHEGLGAAVETAGHVKDLAKHVVSSVGKAFGRREA
jgi:hypothetical protein